MNLSQSRSGNLALLPTLLAIAWTRYDLSFSGVTYYLVSYFSDIVMMRKCLPGIKERAETLAETSRVQPTSQPKSA